MTTPSQAISSTQDGGPDSAAGILREAGPALRKLLSFLWSERNWLIILLPYALACWLPVQYSYRNWGASDGVLGFQVLVPFGAALLAWQRRARLQATWRRAQSSTAAAAATASSSPSRRRRVGKSVPLWIGFAVYGFGHLVHVDSFLAVGLIIMLAGIIFYLYGGAILKALAVPVLFLFLMVEIPDSLLSQAGSLAQRCTEVAASAVLNAFGAHTVPGIDSVNFPDHGLAITVALSGLNLLLIVVVTAFWYSVYTRRSALFGASLVAFSAGFTVLVHLMHVVVIGLTSERMPEMSRFLAGINVWVMAVVIGVVIWYIAQAFQLVLLRMAILERRRARQRASDTITGKVDRALDPVFRVSGKGVQRLASRQRSLSRGIDRIFNRLAAQNRAYSKRVDAVIGKIFSGRRRQSSRRHGKGGGSRQR